jgi:hypothetical protein
MKGLIFLDIDGVVCTAATLAQRARRGHAGEIVADRDCILHLNRILRETGADIVLSSAWRFSGLLEMRAIAALWGIEGRIIDLIPDLATKRPGGLWEGHERWKEIERWLIDNPSDGTRMFVIIDDIRDMGRFADYHVCTEETVGLTAADADKAIRILRGEA